MGDQHPPPGWYTNAQGHTQWWDGVAWGPYAPQPSPSPHAHIAQQHPGSPFPVPAQPTPAAVTHTKPGVSGLVWVALCLAIIALLAECIALLPLFGIGWRFEPDANGELPMSGMTQSLPHIPMWAPMLLALGAVTLAIFGLRRSERKRAAVVVLVLSGFAVAAPVIVPPILILLGVALYAAAGIGSELSGGTPLG